MSKPNDKIKKNRGMTYVELIVVLGIFSVMLSIAIFNYKKFQAKVDIKNLANDIALKLVEAQKFSISGKWNSAASASWKPAYGLYFNVATSTKFVYFADLDNLNDCNAPQCTPPNYSIGGEVLDIINITKGNTISAIQSYVGATPTTIANPLSVSFKRPDSRAFFKSNGVLLTGFDYVQVTVTSPQTVTARIKFYPSGRIQIN